MKKKELTPKQKRFVDEYLIDLNATQAAIRAGYKEKTARFIAAENLTKPIIQEVIQKAMNERSKRTEVTQDRTLKELARIGFSDIRKYFDEDGSLKKITDLDDDAAAVVSSVEVDELFEGRGEDRIQIGYTRKIKLWDKNSALEKIGKHLKMFTEKMEFPGKDGNPQDITQRPLSEIDVATRIAFLLQKAIKKKTEEGDNGQD
jgi:phage terminase small subunit